MKITKGNLLGRILVPTKVYTPGVRVACIELTRYCHGSTCILVEGVWLDGEDRVIEEEVYLYEFACFNSNQMRQGRQLLRKLVNAMLEAGEQAVMYWEHDAQGVLVPVLVTKE